MISQSQASLQLHSSAGVKFLCTQFRYSFIDSSARVMSTIMSAVLQVFSTRSKFLQKKSSPCKIIPMEERNFLYFQVNKTLPGTVLSCKLCNCRNFCRRIFFSVAKFGLTIITHYTVLSNVADSGSHLYIVISLTLFILFVSTCTFVNCSQGNIYVISMLLNSEKSMQ